MKKNWFFCLFILLLPVNSIATTLFSDNFDDGNTTGWSFYGNDSGAWSVSSGILNHNAPAGYDGTVEFALIDGITTPERFTLEADISIISSNRNSDWGHVGFVWGVNDLVDPFQSFNASYLRTHQDRVTNWSMVNGTSYGEYYLDTPSVTNGFTYHLTIDVDYISKIMTTSMGANSTTFSGTAFENINKNLGGGIGLISWNDNITFDNVILSTPTPSIPEPSSLALLGLGLAGFGFSKKKKISA
ncbi:MAG: PEP-CTERM sorting domain-containing protein [Gammaproteobacteria bacterium]|nr:PEP-CTERM sorting domain-containing protein [Gammaproteobacteria bacterium]